MSQPPPPSPATVVDLAALRRALGAHWRGAAACFGAAVLLGLAVGLLTEPQYEAVAVLQLLPRAGREMALTEVVTDEAGYLESRDRARTQIAILLSRAVRQRVLEAYAALGYDDLPQGAEGLDTLERSMSAAPREDTQLVEVRVRHEDRERAAILANLVADVYCAFNLEARTDAAREARGWLEGQEAAYRDTLSAASDKRIAFEKEKGLVDAGQEVDGITTRMRSLEQGLGDTTTRRVLLEGKLAEHERLLGRGEHRTLQGMFQDGALANLAKERASAAAAAAEAEARYGELHPERQRAADRLAQVDAVIAAENARNIEAERAEVRALARQESEISAELAGLRSQLLDKQSVEADLAELRMEEDRARNLYAAIGERGAEVELQARTRLNDVRVVDRALAPLHPVTPNLPLDVAVGAGVGLAAALALAFGRDSARTGRALSFPYGRRMGWGEAGGRVPPPPSSRDEGAS